jgi:NAD(P)-dependent dehydrogenase (short-subunit alcohol dehydrogenase family)
MKMLVTGGNRGLGQHLVERFGAQGKVVLMDLISQKIIKTLPNSVWIMMCL